MAQIEEDMKRKQAAAARKAAIEAEKQKKIQVWILENFGASS